VLQRLQFLETRTPPVLEQLPSSYGDECSELITPLNVGLGHSQQQQQQQQQQTNKHNQGSVTLCDLAVTQQVLNPLTVQHV
jgi:hypothetical protein